MAAFTYNTSMEQLWPQTVWPEKPQMCATWPFTGKAHPLQLPDRVAPGQVGGPRVKMSEGAPIPLLITGVLQGDPVIKTQGNQRHLRPAWHTTTPTVCFLGLSHHRSPCDRLWPMKWEHKWQVSLGDGSLRVHVALNSVAQVVGASSRTPKSWGLDAVRAQAWVVGLIPSQGMYRRQQIDVSLLSFSFPLSLKSINIYI